MIHLRKGIFAVALLLATGVSAKVTTFGRSYFSGVSNHLPAHFGKACCDPKDAYTHISTDIGFFQSWNHEDLAKYISFNGKETMRVQGTSTAGTTDIQAINYLLGDAFDSTIKFAPQVRTFQADFNLGLCLNELMEGLFASAKLPVVHARWNANLTESGITADATTAAEAFVNDATSNSPYANMVEAFKGDKTIAAAVLKPMAYGKIEGTVAQTKTRVGNATLSLGYKLVDKENAHFSVAVSGLLNGAGASKAVYAFEPIIGTMGRHGFGGELNGHVRLYEHNDYEFSAHLQGSVYTLFDATVKRSYDFRTKHGVGSRYLLLKTFAADNTLVTNGYISAINVTTLDAKIGVDAMWNGDLALRMKHGNLSVDVAYGVAGQTKEKFKSWVSANPFTTNYGAYSKGLADANTDNPARDIKLATNTTITGLTTAGAAPTVATGAAGTYLALTDLDTTSGMSPMTMSHQVSANLTYVWADNKWMPTVGLGGSAEICGKENNSLSQWGVQAHVGFSF